MNNGSKCEERQSDMEVGQQGYKSALLHYYLLLEKYSSNSQASAQTGWKIGKNE